MQVEIDNELYDIIITRKRNIKGTYIRVKEDLNIYVSTNMFYPNFMIKDLISKNYDNLVKMIKEQKKKISNNEGFFYLGKKYNIIYIDDKSISFDENNVYMSKDFDIDKWYKSKAKVLFLNRLEEKYNEYNRSIPHPTLRIRKMKTRWGVCNIKSHVITLNLELIKRDQKYLDYVIVHELTHLVHADHTKRFWNCVEENFPNYKRIVKEMREFL
jgi:predicted metal-dependent hydrolase